MAYDRAVTKVLAGMGVDPKYKEKKMREERPRVSPRVAGVLESLGVSYKQEDIQGEPVNEAGMNPLDAPGQQPAVDPNGGQRNGPSAQNNQQGQQQQQNMPRRQPTPAKPAQVKLKDGAGSQINTLQDISDKLTQATGNIKLVDTLIQALSENNASDNRIETHKLTLKGPIQALVNSVADLAKLVE